MQGWSLGLGRWLGVEVRLHPFLLLTLVMAMIWAISLNEVSGRGLLLWLLLVITLLLREAARALGAAWYGLPFRVLLLMPFGAAVSLEGAERSEVRSALRRVDLVGPAANLLFCLVLAGLIRTISPSVDLVARPWIAPGALLRSWVWLNLLFALMHAIPATLRASGVSSLGSGGLKLARGAGGLLPSLVMGMVIAGLLLGSSPWLIVAGGVLLIVLQLGATAGLPDTEAEAIRMRDVMLTEFTTISAADTIEDALERAIHTLQDVFPVVRGDNMVGAVSRPLLVRALAEGGNSYVQGVMARSFHTAEPNDRVLSSWQQLVVTHGVPLVPILEADRVIGIVTPQNLSQSLGILNQRRRLRRALTGTGE